MAKQNGPDSKAAAAMALAKALKECDRLSRQAERVQRQLSELHVLLKAAGIHVSDALLDSRSRGKKKGPAGRA